MKKSIGKKVLFMMLLLGVLFIAACAMNASALSIITAYNKQLSEILGNTQTDEVAAILVNSNIRVEGTIVFNVVLVAIMFILIIIMVINVNLTIVRPTRKASDSLGIIVDKIEQNKGDLTERIPVTTKDEVGQLVKGINGFLETLQSLMCKIQKESSGIMESANTVTVQIKDSNSSALNVSSATEELAASMQEISATLDQIAIGSGHILDKIHEMNDNVEHGSGQVESIKSRAQVVQKHTIESKAHSVEVFQSVENELQGAVKESRSVEKINELTDNILT